MAELVQRYQDFLPASVSSVLAVTAFPPPVPPLVEESDIDTIRQEESEVVNMGNDPVKTRLSHTLFVANLPWDKELKAEEVRKTLEDAGIHGIVLVKIGEYVNRISKHRLYI